MLPDQNTDKMNLMFYRPKNALLREYIEGYYFFSEKQHPVRYFTFPNNFGILTVAQNAQVLFKDHTYTISAAPLQNIVSDFVFRYTQPLEIVYENMVNEITLYFKPLAIHYFITHPSLFDPENTGPDPFAEVREAMSYVLSEPQRDKQIEMLEAYWLSRFQQKDLTLMANILSEVETNQKMEEIASRYRFTRQYLNKLFLKYMGKTPSEYRKIHRFRHSLLQHGNSRNLTELSHGALFYDQSHFIRDFKSFTNTNPGTFFENVDTGKGNVWLFI